MQYRLLLIVLSCLSIGISGCASLPSMGGNSGKLDPANADAQYRLGLKFTVDEPQDYAQAAKWFRAAAQQGHQHAQYMLGVSYYVGRGIERDYTQALDWFEQAAEQGHARAQYQLGEMYMNGRGITKEPDWAARWYGKAAEQKHANARFSLGVIFARGLGLPVNSSRACQWLILAERQEHPTAGTLRKKTCNSLSGEQKTKAQKWADSWQERDLPSYEDKPTIRYVQYRLKQLGYEPGYVDGINGKQTAEAIASFLVDAGLPNEDLPIKSLIEHLRKAG